MDIRSWCCNSGAETIHLGLPSHDESTSTSTSSAHNPARSNKNKLRWRELWMKLKKEKRSSEFQVPSYDLYTYSQNFDHGIAWNEPEDFSRSFSVRFADPSRTYNKKRLIK